MSRDRNWSWSLLARFTNARPAAGMSLRSNPSRCRCTPRAAKPAGARPDGAVRGGVGFEVAAAQVLAPGTAFGRLEEQPVVERDGGTDDLAEALLALAVLPDVGVVVAERDAGARRQTLDGLDEVQLLGLANERDRVAALLAAEAVPDQQFGIDRERRGLLGVERAQAHEAAADALEGDVLPDQRHQVGALPDPGDVVVEDAHRRQTR